ELLADANDLARPPAALPETAVVEGEHREPGVVEPPGERVGARLLGHRAATGHDHAGAIGPRIVPGGTLRAAADESHLFSPHGHFSLHGHAHVDLQKGHLLEEVNHVVHMVLHPPPARRSGGYSSAASSRSSARARASNPAATPAVSPLVRASTRKPRSAASMS